MRDEIKAIVRAGGSVRFPYKIKMSDWMGEASIGTTERGPYVHDPRHGFKKFEDLDKTVDCFIKLVFNKKNIGLAIEGIYKHKMTTEDLDELTDREIKKLIKEYFDQHYDADYGHIV